MFVFILFCKIICISPITSKRFVYNKSLIIILSKKNHSLLYLERYLVNTRCGTHHIPIHITQSIKLGHHNLPHLNP